MRPEAWLRKARGRVRPKGRRRRSNAPESQDDGPPAWTVGKCPVQGRRRAKLSGAKDSRGRQPKRLPSVAVDLLPEHVMSREVHNGRPTRPRLEAPFSGDPDGDRHRARCPPSRPCARRFARSKGPGWCSSRLFDAVQYEASGRASVDPRECRPVRRQPYGPLLVDGTRAITRSKSCFGDLTLADMKLKISLCSTRTAGSRRLEVTARRRFYIVVRARDQIFRTTKQMRLRPRSSDNMQGAGS